MLPRQKEITIILICYFRFIDIRKQAQYNNYSKHRLCINKRGISNKYILIAYDMRKELYDYFNNVRKSKTLTADYITQEYVLSLSEKYALEKNKKNKLEIKEEIKLSYDKWLLQSETKNMIFKKITEAMERAEKE